jgi:hypothetical protein
LEPEFNETFELQEVDMPLQLPLRIEATQLSSAKLKPLPPDARLQVFDWDDPNEEDDQADVQELQVKGGSELSSAELVEARAMSSMVSSDR